MKKHLCYILSLFVLTTLTSCNDGAGNQSSNYVSSINTKNISIATNSSNSFYNMSYTYPSNIVINKNAISSSLKSYVNINFKLLDFSQEPFNTIAFYDNNGNHLLSMYSDYTGSDISPESAIKQPFKYGQSIPISVPLANFVNANSSNAKITVKLFMSGVEVKNYTPLNINIPIQYTTDADLAVSLKVLASGDLSMSSPLQQITVQNTSKEPATIYDINTVQGRVYGSEPLNNQGIVVPNDGTDKCMNAILQPNQTCTFNVTFDSSIASYTSQSIGGLPGVDIFYVDNNIGTTAVWAGPQNSITGNNTSGLVLQEESSGNNSLSFTTTSSSIVRVINTSKSTINYTGLASYYNSNDGVLLQVGTDSSRSDNCVVGQVIPAGGYCIHKISYTSGHAATAPAYLMTAYNYLAADGKTIVYNSNVMPVNYQNSVVPTPVPTDLPNVTISLGATPGLQLTTESQTSYLLKANSQYVVNISVDGNISSTYSVAATIANKSGSAILNSGGQCDLTSSRPTCQITFTTGNNQIGNGDFSINFTSDTLLPKGMINFHTWSGTLPSIYDYDGSYKYIARGETANNGYIYFAYNSNNTNSNAYIVRCSTLNNGNIYACLNVTGNYIFNDTYGKGSYAINVMFDNHNNAYITYSKDNIYAAKFITSCKIDQLSGVFTNCIETPLSNVGFSTDQTYGSAIANVNGTSYLYMVGNGLWVCKLSIDGFNPQACFQAGNANVGSFLTTNMSTIAIDHNKIYTYGVQTNTLNNNRFYACDITASGDVQNCQDVTPYEDITGQKILGNWGFTVYQNSMLINGSYLYARTVNPASGYGNLHYVKCPLPVTSSTVCSGTPSGFVGINNLTSNLTALNGYVYTDMYNKYLLNTDGSSISSGGAFGY